MYKFDKIPSKEVVVKKSIYYEQTDRRTEGQTGLLELMLRWHKSASIKPLPVTFTL